ncbi:hypothetical protein [Maledivibacter halophilus]|uniref:Uncharacterized protein n=1 Tax=Maledivibacter halophilus TaxID=36842 RepID=A0A1T5MKN7_9FIRM|nr:hypothetical protein [Maledivibacter halophilus]SKC88429.1 hypothetical protein SAMN02194393_04879 [Maledivibacter halophilus]
MLKKIITGTLVLIVLSTSSVVVYAVDPQDSTNVIDVKKENTALKELDVEIKEEKKEEIQIISPKINSDGEVVPNKNLVISVNLISDSPVTLNMYKVSNETQELLFDPQVIEPSDQASDFDKNIKDFKAGEYKMVFTREGEEEPIEEIEFKVKKTEEVVDKVEKDPLSLPTNPIDLTSEK